MTNFFFQAEDGIRDADVTGVQTCALPIYENGEEDQRPFSQFQATPSRLSVPRPRSGPGPPPRPRPWREIGRASCRERVESLVVAEPIENKFVVEEDLSLTKISGLR